MKNPFSYLINQTRQYTLVCDHENAELLEGMGGSLSIYMPVKDDCFDLVEEVMKTVRFGPEENQIEITVNGEIHKIEVYFLEPVKFINF